MYGNKVNYMEYHFMNYLTWKLFRLNPLGLIRDHIFVSKDTAIIISITNMDFGSRLWCESLTHPRQLDVSDEPNHHDYADDVITILRWFIFGLGAHTYEFD